MKKYLLFILITPLLLSGCWLFEESELSNAEMSVDIDAVINENVNTEIEEGEELTIDEVFTGTWTLTMNYDEFYTVSTINIDSGEYDSKKHYNGTLHSLSSIVYDVDGEYPTGESDEVVDYEIDGQKIRFSSETSSFWGTINLETAYASGDFTTTLGSGTWKMTLAKSQ